MNKVEIKELANKLFIEPSDDVINLTNALLDSIDEGLKDLEEFDLEAWRPQSHINEKPISFFDLRKDEVDSDFYLKKSDVLANSKQHNDDCVIIRKVINEE
ncbi:glutamyl-tRNA amidotransferase [Metamycoplasma equirhinis]|uniref:glutamyl-tRNA amidotransferase n=1 Tax=Metamycoplasma equirhinis TaxID=92402 RepID=UPI0035936CF2